MLRTSCSSSVSGAPLRGSTIAWNRYWCTSLASRIEVCKRGRWNSWDTTCGGKPLTGEALARLAAAAGDAVSFVLGRRLGRPFLERHGPRVRVGPERLGQVERFYARHGFVLGGYDRMHYAHDPALRDETALFWYLDLGGLGLAPNG